jgi:6-pyruvoyltetrahydropterin/6-carboxytetrahydropterin synthase
MYEIKTQGFFSAAHHLLNYEGECENQHGHNWMVEAYVKGEDLNNSNILIDFKILKKELNAVLSYLDHTDINELPEFTSESPSSEMIAYFIYNRLKEKIVQISKITVWETQTSCASYFEEE